MEGEARSGGGARGCEVRRIHIIYFLTHMGRFEHPHLLRLHHLHRNGVYLRDVKRWLADLRGQDMPKAFSWSYKRRYKSGYVWQDLVDDDLITPISDNEYVLKGSQIIVPNTNLPSLFDPKRKSMSKADEVDVMQPQQTSPVEETEKPGDTRTGSFTATPEIYQESQVFGSDRSTLTEDSTRPAMDSPERGDKNLSSSSFYASLLSKKTKKNGNNSYKNYDSMSQNTPFLQEPPVRKSTKTNSMGASNMFRNLITCGSADTNDAVFVSINRDNKASSDQPTAENNNNSSNKSWNQQKQKSSRRSFESKKQQKENGFSDPKVVPAAYKPVGRPTCSQCGKIFKPEKMYSHMKSCSGMKAMAKTTPRVSIEKKTQLRRQDESLYEESNKGYFLTN
ncbi:protein UPSTREAM OF FLC-like isoform X1 [Tripterygium wilfordii]|uniref:Protein UPSTREAM OF FLC-like isoform X1 n=2 Tax=Tripterygium wilfordii TaxID=458696 RepID=A0A7J7E262_TRIWF|nr:protein UPSTREAM OF FLC-like isoform X1 [Tripterygium wilfordii]